MEDADTTDTSPESGKIVTRPGTACFTMGLECLRSAWMCMACMKGVY